MWGVQPMGLSLLGNVKKKNQVKVIYSTTQSPALLGRYPIHFHIHYINLVPDIERANLQLKYPSLVVDVTVTFLFPTVISL